MTGSGRSGARSRIKSSSSSSAVDDNDVAFRNRDKPNLKLRRDRNRADHSSLRILNVNLKIVLGIGFLAFLFTSYFIYKLVNLAEEPTKRRVITPFPAPKLMDLPQFQGKHKESLYWGTYRPHVYFGVRARAHRSLLAGLMWIGVRNGQYFMRHVCQDSDELSSYGWRRHNGRDFGHQVLVDQGLTLGTTFLKSKGDGIGYGGDWATRLDVSIEKTIDEGELLKSAHLFFYLADEDGNSLSLNENVVDTRETSLIASGSRRDVGDWELHLKSMFYKLRENGLGGPWVHEGNMCYASHGGPRSLGVPLVPLTSLRAVSLDDLEVHYSGIKTSNIHNLSDLVQQQLGAQARKFGRLQLPDMSDNSPNTLVFQISARIPFKIDFAFVSGTHFPNSRVEERVSNLTGSLFTSHLKEKEREFDNKFMKSFDLANKLDSESVSVGKAAIANLLGGIGYFYGQSKIALQRSSNIGSHDNFIQYWSAELFTAVPSRPFFPRGFLWDEGFHQLLIWRWDVHLCLDIVGHWLDLMNVDGWIPREQILGAEALSKVPEEFVAQHPTNGNPPTLFLVLRDIIHALKRESFTATESSEIFSFLERSFVRLEAWFQWFNTTQSGKKQSSYYWHGRDRTTIRELNPKTLSSGLDDYPRSTHPTDDERHIDLRCWMFLAADCLHSITELFEDKKEVGKVYHSTAKLLSDFDLLNQMHFDDAYGAYMDFGNHTDKVRLSWREVVVGQNYINRELIRQVLEKPNLKLVPHVGYVSLFPFIAKIIPPDSWILGKQLDIISNRSLLWTDFGLRSLSKTSSLYMKRNTEHDPPYWRGPIWMNINYLVLSALHHYSREHGPYMDRARNIHDELRNNLIRNIVRNYQQTGFFWEQFDQKNGKGKGARVFTGWTSLVLLTMAEAYS